MNLKLTDQKIKKLLPTVPLWKLQRGKLQRVFIFKNFIQAFSFMTAAALAAEKMNHHPTWTNVWNKVTVILSTHDVDGLTELDFKLARLMDLTALNKTT